MSIDETHNSDSSNQKPSTNEQIEGTPFRIIHLPEHGWFITLGTARVTPQIYKTKNQALKLIKTHDWQLICNVIVTLFDQLQTMQKTIAEAANGKTNTTTNGSLTK